MPLAASAGSHGDLLHLGGGLDSNHRYALNGPLKYYKTSLVAWDELQERLWPGAIVRVERHQCQGDRTPPCPRR